MDAAITSRRWTRGYYERLVESGVFVADDRVELVAGRLIVAEPKASPHATAVALTAEALRAAFGAGWLVRVQDPIALDDESEPEPDLAVVAGRPRDYTSRHPARPVLVVEVADLSLAMDRDHKGSLYARARLREYWIVNLLDRTLEVYRRPAADPAAPYGWRFRRSQSLGTGGVVSPLGRPSSRIAVADLLP